MLALALLLAASGPSRTADAVAELSRGSALYRVCQAEVRLMDLPSLTQAKQSDLLNGSYCVGYVNGYLANVHPATAVCTNGEAIGPLIRIYVSFMEKNPDLMDQDRNLGLNRALQDAYPCPAEGAPHPGSPAQTTL